MSFAVHVGLATVIFGFAPAQAQSPRTSADFDQLIAAWQLAPAETPEEQAIEDQIRSLATELLGEATIARYGDYLRAETESQAESDALDEVRSIVSELGLRWERARAILSAYWRFDPDPPVSPGMPRAVTSISPVHLTVDLESTQGSAVAGGRFAVLGTITNRTNKSVWILNRHTRLLAAPEVWGIGGVASLPAFFPSLTETPNDARSVPVRIDAGKSYQVIWLINPRNLGERRRPVSLFQFLHFRPGTYRFTALVHAWVDPPRNIDEYDRDLSGSQLASGSARIEIGLPITILLFGAAAGGLVAFLSRLLGDLRNSRTAPALGWPLFVLVGTLSSVLVAAIGTVLVSRIGGAGSFVSLTINDVWGAVASGFMLEWLGLRRVLERVRDGNPTDPEAESAPDPTIGVSPAANDRDDLEDELTSGQ